MKEEIRLERHRLAANLAVAFMRRGAQAVIAAGWEVDDIAAEAFASAFYTEICVNGSTFGQAIEAARQAAFERVPNGNTWGAYQCYGDPEYRLLSNRKSSRGRSATPRPFVSKNLAIREIENIGRDAVSQSSYNLEKLRNRMKTALERIDESWLGDSQLNQAIANSYSDTGDFKAALEYFDKAIGANKSAAAITAIEQRANIRARYAAIRYLDARESGDVGDIRSIAISDINQSIKDLNNLDAIGHRSSGPQSVERLRLLGSAYRRLAVAESCDQLVNMAEHYFAAYLASTHSKPESWSCDAAVNCHGSLYLLDQFCRQTGYKEKTRKPFQKVLDTQKDRIPSLEAIADRCRNSGNDFWDLAMLGDVALCKALYTDSLEKDADQVLASYSYAWERGGHQRNMNSILETLAVYRVLLERLNGKGPAAKLEHLPTTIKVLKDIELRLRMLTEQP